MIYPLKMRLLLLLLPYSLTLKAQTEVVTFSPLLLALDDTIKIFQNEQLLVLSSLSQIKKSNKEIRIALDKSKGAWLHDYKVCTRGDTLPIRRTAEEALIIPVTNGFDTIQLMMNFFNPVPTFSRQYREENLGKVRFDVPPVYELVHIAFALTDAGMLSNQQISRSSFYFDQMLEHFWAYRQHPLIASLNKIMEESSVNLVLKDYAQQSLPLTFEGGTIVPNQIYPKPYRVNPWWGTLLQELQDFADQTDYLSFYQTNKGYYQKLLHEQQQFLPIDSLWGWLENNFPESNQSYRIILSPLSKNTVDHARFSADTFSEYVLFLDDPENVLLQATSNSLREASLLKQAFDGIIPFYQQSLLTEHHQLIEEVFSDQSVWLANGLDLQSDQVFEAYMGNAIFCLWIENNYLPEQASKIRQQLESTMLQQGYIRFYAFSRQLVSLYQKYEGKRSLSSLYEELLRTIR